MERTTLKRAADIVRMAVLVFDTIAVTALTQILFS